MQKSLLLRFGTSALIALRPQQSTSISAPSVYWLPTSRAYCVAAQAAKKQPQGKHGSKRRPKQLIARLETPGNPLFQDSDIWQFDLFDGIIGPDQPLTDVDVVNLDDQADEEEEQEAYGIAEQLHGISSPPPLKFANPNATHADVWIFWDLDNKYPVVLDYERVVSRLKGVVEQQYGRVAGVQAYANYRTLNYVPQLWEAAEEEGMVHPLERDKPSELRCELCGRRFGDPAKLAKHFKQLHEQEHRKRAGLNSNAKKKSPHEKKYLASEKATRYREAAKSALPRVRGFNLEGILKKQGVHVTAVKQEKQAADVAINRDAGKLLQQHQQPAPDRQPILCIMSDDHGFEPLLKLFRSRGWNTLVVAKTPFQQADAQLNWDWVVYG